MATSYPQLPQESAGAQKDHPGGNRPWPLWLSSLMGAAADAATAYTGATWSADAGSGCFMPLPLEELPTAAAEMTILLMPVRDWVAVSGWDRRLPERPPVAVALGKSQGRQVTLGVSANYGLQVVCWPQFDPSAEDRLWLAAVVIGLAKQPGLDLVLEDLANLGAG
jgi:hypothetical protein